MGNKWKKTFIITLENSGIDDRQQIMTSRIARDKLLVPIQEMWITHVIDNFSIAEINPTETIILNPSENTKGKRRRFANGNVTKNEYIVKKNTGRR